MEPFSLVPTIAVHPDKICIFNELVRHEPRKHFNHDKIKMPKDKNHNNKVSKQAFRKVSRALDYLIFLSSDKKLPPTANGKSLNFKISFLTLTLSSNQKHTDNEIKSKLLNQFFIEAKKKWNVKNYIWRAEKQANNNIHFHIICDKFIPWSELRDTWNRIQNKLGYVNQYRKEMLAFHKGGFKVRHDLIKKWDYKSQIKAYKTGCANDWHNPNSTDVHSIKLITNVKAYLMKYISKDDINLLIKGRLWGCNYELTDIPGGRIVVDSFITKELRKAYRDHKPKYYKGEYFTVVYLTPSQLASSGAWNVINDFALFLMDRFNYNWQYNT